MPVGYSEQWVYSEQCLPHHSTLLLIVIFIIVLTDDGGDNNDSSGWGDDSSGSKVVTIVTSICNLLCSLQPGFPSRGSGFSGRGGFKGRNRDDDNGDSGGGFGGRRG